MLYILYIYNSFFFCVLENYALFMLDTFTPPAEVGTSEAFKCVLSIALFSKRQQCRENIS